MESARGSSVRTGTWRISKPAVTRRNSPNQITMISRRCGRGVAGRDIFIVRSLEAACGRSSARSRRTRLSSAAFRRNSDSLRMQTAPYLTRLLCIKTQISRSARFSTAPYALQTSSEGRRESHFNHAMQSRLRCLFSAGTERIFLDTFFTSGLSIPTFPIPTM